MSVLDGAGLTGLKYKESDKKIIPEGATAVTAQMNSKGWCLVFETPSGPVDVVVGDMARATRLALRLSAFIRKEQRES